MDNIIDIELTGRSTRRDQKLWQYDYGQVLRIAGKEFPKVTEVQFSLQRSGGHTLDRIGTFDKGVLSVQIPNELLQNKGATSDYTIYAFVYLSGDESGNTKYMIQLPVESRPEPTDPSEDPTIDPSIFKDAVNAVNASANRAEAAEKSAKESADKAMGYAESAGKSKEYVEKARDNAISDIGIEKESALRDIASKTDESVQKIQSQTEESQNSIKQSIADATEKKTELDGTISNATDAKGNLDKAVQSAGNAKSELDASVEEAGEAKTALDSSISSAGEKKLALDATIEHANTVDASLKEQIGSAEQIQANVEQITKNKEDIGSLKEDISNKITKFYASNQGETHITDSDSGKIQDMVLYGKSEQKQYKGINLFPPDTNLGEYVEVSIPKGSPVFWITDGTLAIGGNFRFFNEDKTESMRLGVDDGSTSRRETMTIDAKYVQNLISEDFDLSKICLGVGSNPIYEPYTGGIPSPNPDYPQEIKSVVNPVVKVCGKNLFKVIQGGYISNNDGSIYPAKEIEIGATGFININNRDITVVGKKFNTSVQNAYAFRIGFYDAKKNWIKNIVLGDDKPYNINSFKVTNAEYIRVSAPSGIYDTIQIEKGSEATSYEPYHEQTVQLPYTLNAIPVASGGNVTIDGQQYIADYVDVERGKYVQRVGLRDIPDNVRWSIQVQKKEEADFALGYIAFENAVSTRVENVMLSNVGKSSERWSNTFCFGITNVFWLVPCKNDGTITSDDINAWLAKHPMKVLYKLKEPIENDLAPEEIEALKTLSANYPVTNISVTSDQLDGYTVFNYPISMANGWNYVKQQLGDTRDYIYDMDIKTQDIDLQSAEAYVNSEYAVALTELEV